LVQWRSFTTVLASAHVRTIDDGADELLVVQSKMLTELSWAWCHDNRAAPPAPMVNTARMKKEM
jgi:hypothetical protein